MDQQETDNKAIGISFIAMGVGLIASLGPTFGWQFALSGAPMMIVGMVFLMKTDDEL